MFGRGWGKLSKVGLIAGLIAVAIFAVAIIMWGDLRSAEYERIANVNTRHYSEYTRKKVAETCAAIAFLERAKCVYAARDQEREYRHNQGDLVAQRQSALWAYIMGVAAVIGMALSALGVWLVKTTFDETRKANDIALKIARHQLKAYVTWKDSKVTVEKNPDDSLLFDVKIVYYNAGNTPTEKLELKFYPRTGKSFSESQIAGEITTQVLSLPPQGTFDVGLKTNFPKQWVDQIMAGDQEVYVAIEIAYRDVFGDERNVFDVFMIGKDELTQGNVATLANLCTHS